MEIDRPIMIGCAGRSGSTLFYRLIARHREVGWLSSWHQALPAVPYVALFSRLYGWRPLDSVKHAWFFPKPFSPYRFWARYLPGIARHDRPLMPEDVPEGSIEPLRRTIARIIRLQRARRFLFKVTGWARMAYFQRVFPDLRFVYLRRQPIAVVASWLNAGWLNVAGELGSDRWEWGEVPEPYREIYDDLGGGGVLSACVKTQLDIDDSRRNAALFPGRCHELDYESFVREPKRHLRETLTFCDLRWTPEVESAVDDARIRDYSGRWRSQISRRDAELILLFFERVEALGWDYAPRLAGAAV